MRILHTNELYLLTVKPDPVSQNTLAHAAVSVFTEWVPNWHRFVSWWLPRKFVLVLAFKETDWCSQSLTFNLSMIIRIVWKWVIIISLNFLLWERKERKRERRRYRNWIMFFLFHWLCAISDLRHLSLFKIKHVGEPSKLKQWWKKYSKGKVLTGQLNYGTYILYPKDNSLYRQVNILCKLV